MHVWAETLFDQVWRAIRAAPALQATSSQVAPELMIKAAPTLLLMCLCVQWPIHMGVSVDGDRGERGHGRGTLLGTGDKGRLETMRACVASHDFTQVWRGVLDMFMFGCPDDIHAEVRGTIFASCAKFYRTCVGACSVSTSCLATPGELALTVSCHTTSSPNGQVVRGNCSSYLVGLKCGDLVSCRIVPNPSFHRTPNPQAPVVMIASGAGIAPFRVGPVATHLPLLACKCKHLRWR